jgi:hypothetical protein
LLFASDGNLLVSSWANNQVLVSSGVPADYYQVTLSAGQTVTFSTSTPGDGPGQPANLLDPHIELYDPTQMLVATGTVLADGRNESITYTAPTAGTYYVKVSRQNSTEGDYVLDPISSSPADKGFTMRTDSAFANLNRTPAVAGSGVSSNTESSSAFPSSVFGVIEQNLSAWEDLITKERASLRQALDQLFAQAGDSLAVSSAGPILNSPVLGTPAADPGAPVQPALSSALMSMLVATRRDWDSLVTLIAKDWQAGWMNLADEIFAAEEVI